MGAITCIHPCIHTRTKRDRCRERESKGEICFNIRIVIIERSFLRHNRTSHNKLVATIKNTTNGEYHHRTLQRKWTRINRKCVSAWENEEKSEMKKEKIEKDKGRRRNTWNKFSLKHTCTARGTPKSMWIYIWMYMRECPSMCPFYCHLMSYISKRCPSTLWTTSHGAKKCEQICWFIGPKRMT